MTRIPIACLLGPTASGKTAAALAFAATRRAAPIEIVSVDSALVYRGMDIGTAKPTHEERAAVPHHLIDIIEPSESYSAAQFRADALRLAGEIVARGHVPLFVGGTMLYYKALAEGLDDLPSADAALRAELEAQAARGGWPALHARLAEVDPATAARLAPNDAQRIQRALEIFMLAGRPMSALIAERRQRRAEDATDTEENGGSSASPDGYRFAPIALEPSDRAVLHERIAQRFDAMLEAGFIEEVARLRARADLHPGLPSMRCVGYRQAWAYLDGETDYTAMREQGIFATRQLCKRQLTWLRSMPERVIIDCCSPSATQQAVQAIGDVYSATR
jgi:tRNA dimethylallyltransferase